MEDLELLTEELQAATSRMRQIIAKLENLDSQILEIKKTLSNLQEEQKALKFQISDLEKALNSRSEGLENHLQRTDSKIEETKRELESLRSGIEEHMKGLEASLKDRTEELKAHMAERTEEISSGLSETMNLINGLDSSVAITKSLVVDLKSNLRVFSKEVSDSLRQMDSEASRRHQMLIRTVKESTENLRAVLEKQSRLLDTHTENLLVLQGELISLREVVLRNFGEVLTRLGGVLYPIRRERDE